METNSQFGQFKILRRLGHSERGEVFEAEHTTLNRRFALRLLPEDLAARADAIARFWREALVISNLDHPHIVRMDEFGETDGRYWFRLEWVPGLENGVVTLADYAAQRGGKIEAAELAVILKQILAGLVCAHGAGAVHGGLKPENILLERNADGSLAAKISNFGLAAILDRAVAGGAKQADLPADFRRDVYAAGWLGLRLLTGTTAEEKAAVESLPDGVLSRILQQAAAEEPARRFADAQEMLQAFTNHQSGPPVEANIPKPAAAAEPAGFNIREIKTQKSQFGPAGVALALLLFVLAIISFWWWLKTPDNVPVASQTPAVAATNTPTASTEAATTNVSTAAAPAPLTEKPAETLATSSMSSTTNSTTRSTNSTGYPYLSPAKPSPGDRASANFEFTQAYLAEQKHHLAEALRHYRAAADLDPAWFEAQFNAGVLAHQLGNYPLALAHYEMALAVQPDSLDARYNFALALQSAGYAQDAANEFTKLLRLDSAQVRAHLALANLCAQSLHDPESARLHYLKVLELEPKNLQAAKIQLWLSTHSP